jgi:hypothetical protein
MLGNPKLADGAALKRLMDSPKIPQAPVIERLLNNAKIADSAQLERLLGHANIESAKMLDDLLKNPLIADGAALEHALNNPSLGGLPGSHGPNVGAHEPPGHLPSRHIGKTDADLAARLVAEPGIPAASTFLNAAEADAAAASAISGHQAEIWKWIAGGPTGKLELAASFTGGKCLVRGAATTVPGSGATIVLEAAGGGKWYILTGFPIP